MKKEFSVLVFIGLMMVSLSACGLANKPSNQRETSALTGQKRQKAIAQVGQHYYFQQLSKTEQENYLALHDSLSQFREVISLLPASKKSLIKTIDAFMMDNPEFYWITSADYQFELSDQTAFVTFPLPKDAKKTYQDLQAIGDDIVAKMPTGDDYERIKYFYEVIIKDTDYNKKAFEAYQSGDQSQISSNQDIKSIFIDHLSVCNGYAQAFQFLCQKANIPVAYIRGTGTSRQTQEAFPHAWNAVELNGQYYGVDATWGDPVFDNHLSQQQQTTINYSFLCLPDQIMSLSHQASADITFNAKETFKQVWNIPKCTDDTLIYAKRNHSYMTSFDTNAILNSLKSQLLQGQEQVSLQFANQADYDQMVTDLAANQARYHNLFSHYWEHYSGFSYGLLAETFSISFTNRT
ncbi:transglutaminase domain-containing protein [Streptococcus canis]|uniref:transglutaminase domain-containing protein n=1 Tax=Streptococcus canis TaxID=1329 RepID=UPI00298E8997|nr:transglutaminase domain-containing protein [Streptococcus canis]MDW7797711.1 transglutaminase domain-containing protein [Streptococcus canis]